MNKINEKERHSTIDVILALNNNRIKKKSMVKIEINPIRNGLMITTAAIEIF